MAVGCDARRLGVAVMDADDALIPAGQYVRELTPVIRPNGKVYQPIKQPVAQETEEDHCGEVWIFVLRTHHLDLAYQLANSLGLGDVDRDSAERTWIRDTFESGKRVYLTDPVRGVPAVVYAVT